MDAASTAEKAKSLEETPLSVSHGSVTTGDKTLAYTAKAGYLPIKDADGGIDALLFHTYYTLDGIDDPKDRPLLIAFNGGPGSSSVWLHLGTIGPKRIAMLPDGSLPPPPYIIEDNPFTWLDVADIVFIDPVQTGFSHAKDEETAKKFLGVEGDLDCLSEFIRLFLTRNNRWASPLFMAGESYGTTRGAGLAGRLVDMGIALSGLILISTVLHFQTLSFANGNDLPYVLFLPTYAATAWYHGKLDRTLLRKPVEEIIREAEAFAIGDYASALMQGDRITTAVRTQVLRQLVRLTGLSAE
jgi:carboxypeptidase C (cathepsin A)